MKMCMDHWNALRAAIDTRGLSSFVADSGERAASNLVNELSDGPSIDNFDPLMGAHNAILGNAFSAGGLAIMQGDTCPLCYLNQSSREAWEQGKRDGMEPGQRCPCGQCDAVFPAEPESYDVWIDRAADDQIAVLREVQRSE